jgi:hypothetical protein
MSKQLAKDKLDGTISLENIEDEDGFGASFSLEIPKHRE